MKQLPKIALGAWAWGNDGTFGGSLTAETLNPIFDAAMERGLNLWDTAYAYGMVTSGKVLAGFLKDLPRDRYLVSDKFTPQCANGKPTAMADMIGMQLRLMDLDGFDIYWIHNVWNAPHWTEELAKYFEGKDNVLSGNKVDKSEAFAWTLGEHGAPLIDTAKVSIECEVDGNYELEHFDQFICKVLAVYAEEQVLNEKGKIDYTSSSPCSLSSPPMSTSSPVIKWATAEG